MIMHCIKKIIEELGFELIGNEYVANFYHEGTGNIISCIVKEETDEVGLPIVRFHYFDLDGNFLSSSSLDQIITEHWMNNITLVPKKSNGVYVATMNVTVTVPVNMKDITNKEYLRIVEDYLVDNDNDYGEDVAVVKARQRLGNLFSAASLEYDDIECKDISRKE